MNSSEERICGGISRNGMPNQGVDSQARMSNIHPYRAWTDRIQASRQDLRLVTTRSWLAMP